MTGRPVRNGPQVATEWRRDIRPIRAERRWVHTLHPAQRGARGVHQPLYPHGPQPVSMPIVHFCRSPAVVIRTVVL